MRTSIIYEVAVHHIGALNTLRKRESSFVYFSNLKRAIECVQTTLAVNGWSLKKINYTAVYRTFKIREKFICEYDFAGAKVFQIVITKRTLNPVLTTLGIDEMPLMRK
jgi:hypothetical protein